MELSKNFSLEELCDSATARRYAIDNEPDKEAAANLKKLATDILQPIRDAYGNAITINSAYRCPDLNKKVGGAKTSQHLTGEAADISCTKTSKADLFRMIEKMVKKGELKVGQLIWEYGTDKEPNWIHVSLPRNNGKPNNQILYLFSKK